MISAEFSEFITNIRSASGYRLIEMLALAGFTYPPIIYDYFVAENEHLICNYNPSEGVIPYDTRFLPIITRPPIPRRGRNLRAGRHFSHSSLLHGLRLLQVVQLAQQTARLGNEGLSIGSLREILSGLFGYHRNVTSMLCYELEVYGCLKIHREYAERDTSDDDEVILMPKGHQVITTTLWDPAYLNLCAMRTVLPREILDLDIIQVSRPFSSTQGPERHKLLSEWANNKIVNSLCLLRLIHQLNERQATNAIMTSVLVCSERRDDFDPTPSEIMDLFELTHSKIGAAIDAVVQLYLFFDNDLSDEPTEVGHSKIDRQVVRERLENWIRT